MTPKYIKQLTEFESNINDLSIKSNKRDIVMTKFAAITLCKFHIPFKEATNETLADLFGYNNHSSITYAQQKFIHHLNKPYFKKYKEMFNKLDTLINIKKYNLKINNLSVEYEIIK